MYNLHLGLKNILVDRVLLTNYKHIIVFLPGRFEDSDNDEPFGTFTKPRSRGRMKATLDDMPKRPHSSADTRRQTSTDNSSKPSDDWLELALGSDTKKEKKTSAKTDPKSVKQDGGKKETAAEKKQAPPSAADYLGLAGDDIDPDSLVT